jgi:hypothetical protein
MNTAARVHSHVLCDRWRATRENSCVYVAVRTRACIYLRKVQTEEERLFLRLSRMRGTSFAATAADKDGRTVERLLLSTVLIVEMNKNQDNL